MHLIMNSIQLHKDHISRWENITLAPFTNGTVLMIEILILFNSSNSFLKKVKSTTAFWRELIRSLRKALNTFSFSPTLQNSKWLPQSLKQAWMYWPNQKYQALKSVFRYSIHCFTSAEYVWVWVFLFLIKCLERHMNRKQKIQVNIELKGRT